jgi:3-oxoacyl-[acyl-carrier-protein] synthase III
MQILSVRHALPSAVIDNDDIIRRIEERNRDAEPAALAAATARVRTFLERAGTRKRYMLNGTESAIGLMGKAIAQALERAALPPSDLDFIIYAGVGRGWLEPSTAAAIQREIGAQRAACFDIMEACASWLRAVQVSDAYFKAGIYRKGLIVNCECSLERFCTWDIVGRDNLDHLLAAFTVGEAATATVVAAGDSDLYVTTHSLGQHCDLCMIPLPNAASYLPGYDAQYEPNRFYSVSDRLFETAINKLVEIYRQDPVLGRREHDIAIPHAAGTTAGDVLRRLMRLPEERWYCTHSRYGNTVAASVPVGISAAMDEGRIGPGTRLLAVVGSAGISVGFMSLTMA